MLFDGRNQAPNGWFAVRSLLPSGKTGEISVWHIRLERLPRAGRVPPRSVTTKSATPLIARK